jgi:hypothetical protein
MAGYEDDELAALSAEIERTDPRLAGCLTRFRRPGRSLRWAAVLLLALPAAGWLLDVRAVVGITIALVLCSPLIVALAASRSTPSG